jgi:hypothetical protein
MMLSGKEFKQLVNVLTVLTEYDPPMWGVAYGWSAEQFVDRFQVSSAVGDALRTIVHQFMFNPGGHNS